MVVVVEGNTGRQSFIALAQPCPHLRQSSYRFSLWITNCTAVFSSGIKMSLGCVSSGYFRAIYAHSLFVAVSMISTGGKILRK